MMYRLSENFVIRNILDECIVVPTKCPDNQENGFFALNVTGKIILNGIEAGKEITDIISEICDTFEIDYDSASADTEEFIDEFKSKGIIL